MRALSFCFCDGCNCDAERRGYTTLLEKAIRFQVHRSTAYRYMLKSPVNLNGEVRTAPGTDALFEFKGSSGASAAGVDEGSAAEDVPVQANLAGSFSIEDSLLCRHVTCQSLSSSQKV